MADLAKEAMALWDDLERDSGTPLRWMSGLLNFGDKDYGGDTPEGMKSSQKITLFLTLCLTSLTGTLLGPIANLDRLGMTYQECKLWHVCKPPHPPMC